METLAALIARDGKLGSFEAAGWAVRLAKRLEATHQQGLVHGNVSAYCLLVESANPLTRGILIDVPRVAEPTYRSPERAASGSTSQDDDVWALGVTLFYAITGQMPFQGGSDAEVRQRTLVGPPRLARYGVTDMGLQSIFDQVFAKDLPRRTITVVALRSAIERWMRDPRIGQLSELEDDEEDQPTMMMAAPSLGSLKQIEAAPAPAPPPAPAARPGLAKQTLLGMGSPIAPPVPAAGRPAQAAPFVPPTPPAPPPAEPFQAANIPAPPPVAPPAAGNFSPFDGMALPPGTASAPVSLPGNASASRGAPTMLAMKPPPPQAPVPAAAPVQSGLSGGTIALLAAVWLVVTFGGAAVEYVLITRL